MLRSSACFFRSHKSDLINMNYVRHVARGKICLLVMADGFESQISRRKKIKFLVFYESFKGSLPLVK